MSGLTSLDAVYIALVFIVPGYVFSSLRNHLVAGRRPAGAEYYVGLLTVSSVNFAIIGWIAYLSVAYDAPPIWRAVSWIFVILIFPSALGIASGVCTQKGLIKRLYERFKLKAIHVVPTAWDYKFSTSPGEWVFVVLKDGTTFAGWWGSESFSSNEPGERDILIESVFEVDGDEPWRATSKSVLIAAGEVRSIEFMNELEASDV